MGEWLDWSLPWVQLAQRSGMRFFGHAHGIDISKQLRDPKWRAGYVQYNQASGVITMSQVSRDRLLDLGLEPTKVHVVTYGVEVPDQPLPRAENRSIRCVAVGRMVAKKAPILTLDAFRRAAETCPSLRLDYVGDGQLLAAAIQFVRAFDLGDRVTLHGGRPNEFVQELMKRSDIFLQHSMVDPETGDEEGLPVAILEGMARGLPVVSTRHAGIPEAVVEGKTGYLVDEGDSHGMADRLIMLARDPDLRFRMGQAGWHRVKEHFSWEKEKCELLAILGLTS
jgi:glycosyltransferase involved in cell wall biosynthesis